MYRDHHVLYLTPRQFSTWKEWVYSKQIMRHGGRVTLLGFTLEWTDYFYA